MKNGLFALAILLVGFTSCDKVEGPYSGPSVPEEIYDYYPYGDSAHYAENAWPTFLPNTNTTRNVLIEDFTGHQCIFCPVAADTAHQIYLDYPGRVLISSIHAGPTGGMEGNQELDVPDGYIHNFTNQDGFDIGYYFGDGLAGSPFAGNPNGTVSRLDHGSGYPITSPSHWRSATNSIIAANDLRVNIQAENNYYPETRAAFLHTEIEILDPNLTNELSVVVHLIEDSVVGKQSIPGGSIPDYVHRDIMRGSIDGRAFGQVLDASSLDQNGKHYVDYLYLLPSQYDENNVHFLIYVRDAVTEEVYQVIKQTL